LSKPRYPLTGLLGAGTLVEGDISFEGRLRIDGRFRGRIYSDDLLEVGEQGYIEGQVDVARAVVAGVVEGMLQVRDALEVESTAVIRGELVVARIRVAPGATVEAKVRRVGRVAKDS